jgi:glycosyltransferase involved in cell wall biosynthesis
LNLHDLYPATVVELGLLKNRLVIAVARWMERVAYRNASQIVVAAPRSRRILAEEHGVPLTDVHFVPNLVNIDRCAPGPRDNRFRRAEHLGGEFVVLYAGLMGVAQDLSTIIECARRMQSRRDVVFMLMGDGVYAKKWKALAQDLPNVRFHGPVANAAYTEALQASDVCLVPLSPELKSPALPGKMATIMAAARAMIALVPPWSDAIEVIRESRCGIVTAPGRPDELQSAIESLASNRRLAEELGENGRAYATERLSLEATIPQFARVVARAVDHRFGHSQEWRGVSS